MDGWLMLISMATKEKAQKGRLPDVLVQGSINDPQRMNPRRGETQFEVDKTPVE